ncbi:hypothetical protein [Methanobacterium spitsbergense]|uniref:Uncharacterized protein n=1 Tax=Methanobacterium spitsbergense TaxID=2874285 RepID=A0A8T5UWV5_9EURY|nr:hypothetical protein [Methanobacterium spitsbergense]MBZ2165159.1 hypothetical protein [Methanobacterium spitsbergense]
MVDVKEIKSIDLVSFTMMSSSVNAILALIGAIILLIFFGAFAAFIPAAGLVFASLGISMIILYPILTFLVEITISFVTALIYNMLVPRLGGVKLGIDGNEVRSVPVVPFALILSVVEAIWAFIFGLVLAALLVPLTTLTSTLIPLIANVAANATNMTPATLPTGSAVGTGGVVLALILIIALPILVFIFGFIGHALAAIFYNFIIPRVGGVKLLFTPAGALHEISSIPVVAASLAIASVALIFGLIRGILQLITMAASGDAVGGIVALIASIIVYFIGAFIMVALITIIYNFLAPRIGGVQLGLE